MRSLMLIIFLSLFLPLLPLAASEPVPVTPSTEVEPGREVPDWEARFQKQEEKKDQHREMKKSRKRDEKEEKREQKKEQRREMRKEHREHR